MAVKVEKSQEKMELTVDLADEFGLEIRGNNALKMEIGEAYVQEIKARAQSGNRLGGGKMRRYTKAYAEFKGVGRDDVDLTLTSDMLESLSVIGLSDNGVIIGFNQPDQDPKAFNHDTGDTLPRRPFFGLQKNELKRVKKEFLPDVAAAAGGRVTERVQESDDLDAIVDSFIKGLFDFG